MVSEPYRSTDNHSTAYSHIQRFDASYTSPVWLPYPDACRKWDSRTVHLAPSFLLHNIGYALIAQYNGDVLSIHTYPIRGHFSTAVVYI